VTASQRKAAQRLPATGRAKTAAAPHQDTCASRRIHTRRISVAPGGTGDTKACQRQSQGRCWRARTHADKSQRARPARLLTNSSMLALLCVLLPPMPAQPQHAHAHLETRDVQATETGPAPPALQHAARCRNQTSALQAPEHTQVRRKGRAASACVLLQTEGPCSTQRSWLWMPIHKADPLPQTARQ
jgi:hypothetical protein